MEKGHRQPLSAVVIALNEEGRIADCLASVAWADEIVVVDSGSSDSTREIALRYTDRVHEIPWRGFGPQKQAAVELASHDMILVVDCDERVTPELAEEITALLGRQGIAPGYSIPRRTFIGRKEIRHCGWYPDRTIRFFDRRKARLSDDLVHERVIVSGEVGSCHGHLLHYSFAGMPDLLAKLNRYTDLSARQMFEKGRRCSIMDLTVRPLFTFLKTYVMKLGFLDGVEGLEIAVSNGITVFFKYAKLRELKGSAGSMDDQDAR